jgi:predicted anti-sigma-YlaC factor YlaD
MEAAISIIPTCREMSELVTGYMERALSPVLRRRARLHLFLCDPCRRYYDQMRRTVALLSGRSAGEPPSPEVEQRLVDSATRPPAPPSTPHSPDA